MVLLLLACHPEKTPVVTPPVAPSFHLAATTAEIQEASSPLSLVASDGTALTLQSLVARAVVEDPLAWTELRLRFRNPDDRVLEGRFQLQLPEGASLARFAMKVHGYWQEGEVIERRRATRVYEDFLHRRQDPALLEQEAADLFSARVFPIQPHAEVELLVSWSGAVPAEGWSLPLRGLGPLAELDVAAQVPGDQGRSETFTLKRQDFTPDSDFTLPEGPRRLGLQHGEYVVARVTAPPTVTPDPVASLYVLVDSSASRALSWEADLGRVTALAEGLAAGAGPDTPLAVAAFDQGVAPIFEGRAADFGEDDVARLRERMPLGASDPAGALRWLAGRIGTGEQRYDRVLLVTDAVSTAGDASTLRSTTRALGGVGVERLDVLASGGLLDEDAARLLVTAGLPRDGVVVHARLGLHALVRGLERAPRSGVPVEVEGAAWVWPETLDGVAPGEDALVVARLPEGGPARIRVGGALLEGTFAEGQAPLVERAAAVARVERLVTLRDTRYAEDPDLRDALARQATDVALAGRVVSPWTAMLVLESAWDYQRYGIDQLASVVTVGPTGLEVEDRRGQQLPWGLGQLGYLGARSSTAVLRGGAGVVTGDRDETVDVEKSRSDAPMASAAEIASTEPRPAPDVQAAARAPREERRAEPPRVAPWSGRYAEVRDLLSAGRAGDALAVARDWRAAAPGEVLAHLALGDAFARTGDLAQAARAYGSLIDLFPGRADLRRAAANHLEALDDAAAQALALDSYAVAQGQRPDHPTSHRLYAFALARAGRVSEAFDVILAAQRQGYRWDQGAGVRPVLREDAAILGAALVRAEPGRRDEVVARLAALGLALDTTPSLRFVLTWETDANDVDLHVQDATGEDAFFAHRALASGGALHMGVFNGYGPECFTRSGAGGAWPYRVQAHYYRRGPMGYGIGKVEIVTHDGEGGLTFDERPYVVMNDDAWIDLGVVEGPLG